LENRLIKLCKDCKYVETTKFLFWRYVPDTPACLHDEAVKTRYVGDLVHGGDFKTSHYLCKTQRKWECGSKAIFWEPRKEKS
jgi:hypothetical protein